MGRIIMVGNFYSAWASGAELDPGFQCKAFNWEGRSQKAVDEQENESGKIRKLITRRYQARYWVGAYNLSCSGNSGRQGGTRHVFHVAQLRHQKTEVFTHRPFSVRGLLLGYPAFW